MQIYDFSTIYQKKYFTSNKIWQYQEKIVSLHSQNKYIPMNQHAKEEELLQSADTLLDDNCKLVLYNDDYHTFDYVIDSLIKICKQTPEQAEQCTVLVHYKGKCVVKSGSYDTLMPMHQALLGQSLTSEILQ